MKQFVSQRHLRATQSLVFLAIEDPGRLAQWWGPEGFTCEFESFDFVENGEWIFKMIGPDGTEYPNRNRFLKIDQPREVVIRHEGAPFFTVTLTIEQTVEGTFLRFVQDFDDPTVLDRIIDAIRPANEQVFDKLERVLAENGG